MENTNSGQATRAERMEASCRAAEHVMGILAAGAPIGYEDPEYPGVVVREYPDGHRIIVHATPGGGTITLTEGRANPTEKGPRVASP